MRADRLVSLVLLLRQRGRLTAAELAAELEVSVRTVLRDIEALSAAGVPVYAERGRHGGYALLPGFRTELTGLTPDEALALLTAGSGIGEQLLGLGPALGSALRKVLDALPAPHQGTAAAASRRVLVDPDTDLLARRLRRDDLPEPTLATVRRAVVEGRRLRLLYASAGREPRWRDVDPVGLVTVREKAYLLATEDGADRTFRLSRVHQAQALEEPAVRSDDVDLPALWRRRTEAFLAEDHLVVEVLVEQLRRDDLLDHAEAVLAETSDPDGRRRVRLTFQDLWHAEWALWQVGPAAEALHPPALRAALHARATAMAQRHG